LFKHDLNDKNENDDQVAKASGSRSERRRRQRLQAGGGGGDDDAQSFATLAAMPVFHRVDRSRAP